MSYEFSFVWITIIIIIIVVLIFDGCINLLFDEIIIIQMAAMPLHLINKIIILHP